MGAHAEIKHVISSEDQLRADLYGFLANRLTSAPDQGELATLSKLAGDDSEMGQAFATVAKLATGVTVSELSQEYDALFIGMGRGELVPFGSYYLTGFLNEKPLAKLRNTMRSLDIVRREGVFEPEDHIGSLMEMMAGLITGRYSDPAPVQIQKEFYEAHISQWASHFFSDLEAANNSRFYQPVGTIGRLFMEIESTAFKMD